MCDFMSLLDEKKLRIEHAMTTFIHFSFIFRYNEQNLVSHS